MATVSYKNRTSFDYRFTVTDLNDADLLALKEMIKNSNVFITRHNKKVRAGTSRFHTHLKNAQRVIIRARGPRPNRWAKDTPRENATHFDVYVNARYIYE